MVEFKFKVQHFTFNIALRLEHRINPISKLIRNSSIFLEFLFLKTLKFKVKRKEMLEFKFQAVWFLFTGTPQSSKKLIYARLGVSRPIYINVDSPNLGFPHFTFLGEAQ